MDMVPLRGRVIPAAFVCAGRVHTKSQSMTGAVCCRLSHSAALGGLQAGLAYRGGWASEREDVSTYDSFPF